MTRPPRPAKVTAAGVLLIVVGADALLAALGLVAVLFWAAAGFAFLPCFAAVIVVGWVPVTLGVAVLFSGIGVLRGRIASPRNVAALYVVLGLLFCVAIGVACLFGLCGLGRFSLRSLDPVTVGAALFVCLNVAAMLVAGELLGRGVDQYETWVRAKAVPLPPDDPDSDGEPLPADPPPP